MESSLLIVIFYVNSVEFVHARVYWDIAASCNVYVIGGRWCGRWLRRWCRLRCWLWFWRRFWLWFGFRLRGWSRRLWPGFRCWVITVITVAKSPLKRSICFLCARSCFIESMSPEASKSLRPIVVYEIQDTTASPPSLEAQIVAALRQLKQVLGKHVLCCGVIERGNEAGIALQLRTSCM